MLEGRGGGGPMKYTPAQCHGCGRTCLMVKISSGEVWNNCGGCKKEASRDDKTAIRPPPHRWVATHFKRRQVHPLLGEKTNPMGCLLYRCPAPPGNTTTPSHPPPIPSIEQLHHTPTRATSSADDSRWKPSSGWVSVTQNGLLTMMDRRCETHGSATASARCCIKSPHVGATK